jgi:hypothetical protein
MCAVLVTAVGAQSPAPSSIWQRVHYPPIPMAGITNGVLMFSVSSGGHTNLPQEEPSHLRFDLLWSARIGVPLPALIADAPAVVVRLHTADGKVVTVQRGMGWVGAGSAGGGTWSLIHAFPWSRNALDEAWFEVRVPGQTWWVELPYGFARNPQDPEVPDRDRNEPRFPPGMVPLGANDILVPWLNVEYELGSIPDGGFLSVKLSNPFDASASVRLHRGYTMEVGPDRNRQNLDSPRITARIEVASGNVTGHELARRLSDDRHTRTDDFTFDRTAGRLTGRAYGTVTFTIGGSRFGVRVPSSLLIYTHGRTDYQNRQWMVVPR